MPEQDSSHSSGISSSGSSSSKHGSSFMNSDSGNKDVGSETEGDTTDKIKQELSKRESKVVFQLRFLVIIILLLAAIGVSVVVYMVTAKGETDKFKTQYEGTSEKVIESFEAIVAKMGSISSVGVAAVIHGLDRKGIDWPFITLSYFQQRCATARELSGALYVTINAMVEDHELAAWQAYSISNASNWITDAYEYQADLGLNDFEPNAPPPFDGVNLNPGTGNRIVYYDANDTVSFDDNPGPYLLTWQTSPYLRTRLVNYNLLRKDVFAGLAQRCLDLNSAILGGFDYAPPGNASAPLRTTRLYSTLLSFAEKKPVTYLGDPMARLFIPLYTSFDHNRKPGAIMMNVIHWRSYFQAILPNNIRGITVVLENTCDGFFTYQLDGPEANVVGLGDHHNHKFDHMERVGTFKGVDNIADGTKYGLPLNHDQCYYSLHVYPSDDFADQYMSKTPILITFGVAMVFVFTMSMFLLYDRLVERRQRLVLAKAAQSTAIVSSLFPKNVRDRLLQTHDDGGRGASSLAAPNHRLKSFLHGDANSNDACGQPIADLFPHCTVLFADIAGFTAWSSTREPEQVFVLLQTVYQAFDLIAKRRKVFKVETIGDSYVAVTGLPDAQPSHAVIMTRFAYECIHKMDEVTRDLETSLGPDTGDLSIRVGLHSGPVTAGVLRGDRARFQLFGDTVNTAARMESTGKPGKIQISQASADELIVAGKEHWVLSRADAVEAKGKGFLRTYWATPGAKKGSSTTSSQNREIRAEVKGDINEKPDEHLIKQERLVEWMVELLVDHLKKIIARRNIAPEGLRASNRLFYKLPEGKTCLDEVKDCLVMPKFDAAKAATVKEDPRNIVINTAILADLRAYVMEIALSYRTNPFHNFEHACHVAMSVKLLKRVVAPDIDIEILRTGAKETEIASHLHDFTHGINSDPLTVFAVAFSALIHDADHRGVSNTQLMKEIPELVAAFGNHSVAEQNSVEVAWNLLMQDRFEDLRKYIFVTEGELLRFRQIIVNVVLATDIFDKELNDLRKKRWDRAFNNINNDKADSIADLKATIVIEHIIQASDVAHTMQHWHVYRKWNERLFIELSTAFKEGRLGADPSLFWYKGELGFFDNYIIPLAKKLKECNVFGVSSDEYLNYAVRNRGEWQECGQEIVEEMMQRFQQPEK